jgi:hypothetical protein
MPAATDRHAHILRGAESIQRLAERADPQAIERLLTQPAAAHLDDDTLDFLHRARNLVSITAQALVTVLESTASSTMRGYEQEQTSANCPTPSLAAQHPGPLDAAEAWRRARLYFSRQHEDPILVHIEEFDHGYQAMPIVLSLPELPSSPTIETPTTLVFDKTTGAAPLWPLLRLDVLASHYRSYKRQAPITLESQS